jgi:hypothetical protein
MIVDNEIKKLLEQSKAVYSNYLKLGEEDSLAEAGELLWECVRASVAQITNIKIDNINALMSAATKMGEPFNQLFFRCYHFHSWYSGGGVPNNFEAEKRIYIESFRSVEKIVKNNKNSHRTKKQRLEAATEAI